MRTFVATVLLIGFNNHPTGIDLEDSYLPARITERVSELESNGAIDTIHDTYIKINDIINRLMDTPYEELGLHLRRELYSSILRKTPHTQRGQCNAYTRIARPHRGQEFQNYGCDHRDNNKSCNAYSGDTDVETSLPILCIKKTGESKPDGLKETRYNIRSYSEVGYTAPIMGSELSSLAMADGICEQELGEGYRMIEHHDGDHRHLWAKGNTDVGKRFWVSINDQKSNPRDCLISN